MKTTPPYIKTITELRHTEANLSAALANISPTQARLNDELRAAREAVTAVLTAEGEGDKQLGDELSKAQERVTEIEQALRTHRERRGALERRLSEVQAERGQLERAAESAIRQKLLPVIAAELPKAREALVQAVARVGALTAIREGIPAGMFNVEVVARRAAGEVSGALAARIEQEIDALKRSVTA